jgi:hypothetical protein
MINNSWGMIIKAGYEPPRVFHFSDDKRLMVELTFLPAEPFSQNGPSPHGSRLSRSYFSLERMHVLNQAQGIIVT